MNQNHIDFIKQVRTVQFWSSRLRNIDKQKGIFISRKEIQTKFFPFPKYDIASELNYLQSINEINIQKSTLSNGNEIYLYKALKSGSINLSLIENNSSPLNDTTRTMMNYLKTVSLSIDAPITAFFQAFLIYRQYNINLFFTVDKFSGRIHTPVTSFPRTHRPNILINEENTVSLDVATMQPLLLANILKQEIGLNDFTTWIENGFDVYELLRLKLKLTERDEAKKKFFEILFSIPNNKLVESFGNANWIEWINELKSKPFKANPHTNEKVHSNLAFILQKSEVKIMFEVWKRLIENGIIFLSVHDEIIVSCKDELKTNQIMNDVLSSVFTYFKINVKM